MHRVEMRSLEPQLCFLGTKPQKTWILKKLIFFVNKICEIQYFMHKQNILLTYMSSTTLQLIFADSIFALTVLVTH